MRLQIEIPIRLVSTANSREHWIVKSKRNAKQCNALRVEFLSELAKLNCPMPSPPYVITLTRLSSRCMDFDNLVVAFKHIRDEISNIIHGEKRYYTTKSGKNVLLRGRQDSHGGCFWMYEQEKAKTFSIKVCVEWEETLLA